MLVEAVVSTFLNTTVILLDAVAVVVSSIFSELTTPINSQGSVSSFLELPAIFSTPSTSVIFCVNNSTINSFSCVSLITKSFYRYKN